MTKISGKETDSWRTRAVWFIVRLKVFYERGDGWLSKVRNIMSIIFYIVAFQAVLEKYTSIRVDMMLFAIVAPTVYIFGNVIIGYLDFTHGIMKKEAVFGTRDVNPFMHEIDKKISRIENMINMIMQK